MRRDPNGAVEGLDAYPVGGITRLECKRTKAPSGKGSQQATACFGPALPVPVLLLNAVREFLDHRVGEHIAGDALHFLARGFGVQLRGKGDHEVLSLANTIHARKTDLAQRIVDGLALWV